MNMSSGRRRWTGFGVVGVSLGLVLGTLALYWPAHRFGFIEVYDDKAYVTENPAVRAGLRWEGVKWAFRTGHAANWHPLTWLSHMADCTLWGLNPSGHHSTNVVLHALNAVLVFVVLRRFTGTFWRAAIVAALFAWHPLQVQSVAWIAERKNLLSSFFGFLSLWAYARYAQTRNGTTPGEGAGWARRVFYGLALGAFALGLMSKPMLVTWPFLMLLLDFWPLGRWSRSAWRGLLIEKIPFLFFSAASSVVTLLVQKRGGAVAPLELLPFGTRLENAAVSYLRYSGKAFYPESLAVIYPYEEQWPAEALSAALLMLLVVSGAAVLLWRRRPWLPVGWFWFVGTLVPTIGLVQVGEQSIADRYVYVPLIGLSLLIAWEAAQWWPRATWARTVGVIVAVAVLGLCVMQTRRQLPHWENNITLFRRAVEVSPHSATARKNLGEALARAGRFAEALVEYEKALQIHPTDAAILSDLGTVLLRLGRADEAVQRLRAALETNPNDPDFPFNLANALLELGQTDAAIRAYEQSLAMKPNHARARHNLAIALARIGRTDEAFDHARRALALEPENAEVHNTIANLLAERGEHVRAIGHYQEALRLDPKLARAHFNLAGSLLETGRTNDALACLRTAAALEARYWQPRAQLASLAAARGDWQEAARWWGEVAQTRTNHPGAWFGLGIALLHLERFGDATNAFARALELQPDLIETRLHLAGTLLRMGDPHGAVAQYRIALGKNADEPRVHLGLARALYRAGDLSNALGHFRMALEKQPDWPEALNDAAWVLATAPEPALRDPARAVELAERANALSWRARPNFLGTLAAAYAAAGRFSNAVAAAEEAIALAEKEATLTNFVARTRARLELYRAGQSVVESPGAVGD